MVRVRGGPGGAADVGGASGHEGEINASMLWLFFGGRCEGEGPMGEPVVGPPAIGKARAGYRSEQERVVRAVERGGRGQVTWPMVAQHRR